MVFNMRSLVSFVVLIILQFPEIGITQNASINSTSGIWIGRAELADLPTSGPAWERLKSAAEQPLKSEPDLSARDREQVQAIAKALYYAKTEDAARREEVRNAIETVMGTEGGDALATIRAVGGWVIAADLINLKSFDPTLDNAFRAWLHNLLDINHMVGNRSIVGTHEGESAKANNFGTAAGFSRAAMAVYLDDQNEIARAAQVFKGWLGDRETYPVPKSAFRDLSWQADPDNPVGINPKGATKEGHSIDGVLPDDQRRGGSFSWPPPKENYVYTALQGTIPNAVILYRAGYDVWNWEDKAILRAFEWLYNIADYPAVGDDVWLLPVVDYYYGTNFWDGDPVNPGKMLDWTDWTHGKARTDDGSLTSISGMVQNVANGNPVENATIELKLDGQTRYQAHSSTSGGYSFNNIDAGTYTLSCSKEGFESWTDQVTVGKGQQLVSQDILLKPVTDSIPPNPPKNINVSGNE